MRESVSGRAQYHGRNPDLFPGDFEVGKQADLILIDGDPHSDIGALRNIWAVFQGGRRIR